MRALRRPSGRATLSPIASSRTFTLTIGDKRLNSPETMRLLRRGGTSVEAKFGVTTPRTRIPAAGQFVHTGAEMRLDTSAIRGYHPTDTTGVTTVGHELHHTTATFNQKSFTEIRVGDMPTSATGPAEAAGAALLAEDPDISKREARELLESLLEEEEPPQEDAHGSVFGERMQCSRGEGGAHFCG